MLCDICFEQASAQSDALALRNAPLWSLHLRTPRLLLDVNKAGVVSTWPQSHVDVVAVLRHVHVLLTTLELQQYPSFPVLLPHTPYPYTTEYGPKTVAHIMQQWTAYPKTFPSADSERQPLLRLPAGHSTKDPSSYMPTSKRVCAYA